MAKGIVAPGRLRVFVCHASADKSIARTIWSRLREAGFESWLDEENLLPGQVWETAILKAIRESDVVIVCLSLHSVSTAGFRHKEIKLALDVADEQPDGRIFVIPVKIEECAIPERLKHLHVSDLTHENGFGRLIRSLSDRAVVEGRSPIDAVAGQSPRILYSVSSWLEYVIGEQYYGGQHTVWCTPDYAQAFNSRKSATPSPRRVHKALSEAVKQNDIHDPGIHRLKNRLQETTRQRGARGELNPETVLEIQDIIAAAAVSDYRPLLYVIPFEPVNNLVSVVPIAERAHPLSREYIINRLPRQLFDVLDLE